MIKKSILAALCCLPMGLMAQKGFTIQGKVGALNAPAKAYLSYRDEGKQVLDSAVLKRGKFRFSGKLSSPVQASIVVKHDTIIRPRTVRPDELYFYIENSVITVTAKDSIKNAVVKGSSANDDERLLRALQRPYKKSADSLMAIYNAMTPSQRNDSAFRKSAGIIMGRTQKGYDSVSRKFINEHRNSYIALQAFQVTELGYNFNPDTAAVRFSRFPESLRATSLGKKMDAMINTGRKTDVGAMAMDFVEYDTTGKAVKLSDFRGRYVLVDFWASWCKPCRAENPNLLKAYNKFKDKNFTILGVSLDDEDGRRAWLGAVAKDNLPWMQTSELKGFSAKSAVLYGVKAIPSNFLIDPNGKIIGRNLRGEELHQKLTSLFSK